ncbi:MAG: RluA family pseudouridine synthase, partial [Treponema sp.]|nr:RluA family pseudouridine synthase [Treponema sp.]
LPVKGDLKYGSPRSEKGGGIRLHGYSLSFPDPSGNGGTIRAEAPPPYRDALWNAFMGEAGTETLSGLNQVPPLQLL